MCVRFLANRRKVRNRMGGITLLCHLDVDDINAGKSHFSLALAEQLQKLDARIVKI